MFYFLGLCRFLLCRWVGWCRNMKICSRYPIPKSLSSGKGLTIASLQFFLCFVFLVYVVFACADGRLCRIRRTIFKDTTKIRQNHRCGTLCILFIISGAPKSLVFLAYRSRNPGLVFRYCDRCAMYCRKFVAPVFWLCVARTVHMEASACATRVSSTE